MVCDNFRLYICLFFTIKCIYIYNHINIRTESIVQQYNICFKYIYFVVCQCFTLQFIKRLSYASFSHYSGCKNLCTMFYLE